ncbi:MAG TPA: tRNA threonylcarbamoyladenosine dehydratase [Verrucomicrobia bacterium]|nr:tRNA threonylcarbamoyladenosine dehydratase [Verrucomicrobiota bacterium]
MQTAAPSVPSPTSTKTPPTTAILNRSALLLGDPVMVAMARAHVIIFGLGGVGSWCAESLVRTGIGHVTLVDSDRICVTNINRQLQATCSTIGQVKTEALRARLLDINPHADILSIQSVYDQETQGRFDLDAYDVVIDAIDSLFCKALLLNNATRSRATVFSAFGAALKLDPTLVRTSEFNNVKGCPLGSKLRKLMRKENLLPSKPVQVVYSEEAPLANAGESLGCGTPNCLCPKASEGPGDQALLNHEWCSRKAVINGSLAHITGIFGLTLAGLVIQQITRECKLLSR